MRIYLSLTTCLLYLASGSSDEIETGAVTVSYNCVSSVDSDCCPSKCILNNNIDNVDISACLDTIEPHCEIEMTAKSVFDQEPCFVEIESPLKHIKRYSAWYRFPSGLKVLKLPWISGYIKVQEKDYNKPYGCHVIQAGLADVPSPGCQPLPESSLFEVPWLNGTLGELDGLMAMVGHRQALNVITEEWRAGESTGLAKLRGLELSEGVGARKFPDWRAICARPGLQFFEMEVKGSASGRKGLREPTYDTLPP